MASALAILQGAHDAEKARLDALVGEAEALSESDPAAALAALDASKDERATHLARLTDLSRQITAETERRDAVAAAPAIAPTAATLAVPDAPKFTAEQVARMRPAEYAANRGAILAFAASQRKAN